MIKKALATVAFISFASTAMADSYPYIGGSVGVVDNTTDSGQTSGVPGVFRGMPFNVFAGFAAVSGQGIYVAGELTGTFVTAELSNANGLKTTYGYGASILPGILLSDNTLAFLRAGIVNSRFTNVGQSSTGGQFGVGLETALTQATDIRFEYDFTAYRSVSTLGSPRSDAFMLGLLYKFA